MVTREPHAAHMQRPRRPMHGNPLVNRGAQNNQGRVLRERMREVNAVLMNRRVTNTCVISNPNC
jgi:hypothetical protein